MYWFDVSMQKAHRMNCFNGHQQLSAKANSGADSEATFGLTAAKFSKIATLKVHHDIVELLITTTADESADMIFTYSSNKTLVLPALSVISV